MGRNVSTYKCPNCNKDNTLGRVDLLDVGTFWHKIYEAKCIHCQKYFVVYEERRSYSTNLVITGANNQSNELGFYLKKRKSISDVLDEIVRANIYESVIQDYVMEFFYLFGLENIEGPFKVGPDFIGLLDGERVEIEVERSINEYKNHGHHKQDTFKNVKLLICLSDKKPSKKTLENLPERICFIKHEHFFEWYQLRRMNYARRKQFETYYMIRPQKVGF